MVTNKKGEALQKDSLAFLEGVEGRYIPCKVLSIEFKESNFVPEFFLSARQQMKGEKIQNLPSSKHRIRVRITKSGFSYSRGEILEESGLTILPRWALDVKRRIILPFHVTRPEVRMSNPMKDGRPAPWDGPFQWKLILKDGSHRFADFVRGCDPIYDTKVYGKAFDRICHRAGVKSEDVSFIVYG